MSRAHPPSRRWTAAERLLAAAILACLILTGSGLAVLHREMTARRAAMEERLVRQAGSLAASVTSGFHDGMEVLRNALLRAAARAGAEPGRYTTDELLAPDRWALEPEWPFGVTPGPIFEVRGGVVTTLSRGVPAGPGIMAAITTPAPSRIAVYRDRLIVRDTDTLLLILDSLPDGRWLGAELPVGQLREGLWRPRMEALDGGSRWAAPPDRKFAPDDTLIAYAFRWVPHETALMTNGDTAGSAYRQSVPLLDVGGVQFTLTLLRPMERLLVPGGMPAAPWPRLLLLGTTALAVIALAGWMAWRALALSRARELFAASVTHELRTPLTGITLFAETLLLDRVSGPDGRRRALQTIAGEAQRLSTLVENVLTMARRGQAEERLQVRPTSLGDLLRSVEDAFAPMLATRGLAVHGAVSGTDIAAIDPEATRRILVNLIDNALRHAAEATLLAVEVIHEDRGVTLIVADDGVGIAAGDALRIWDAWEHGPGGGSGLGLAVVARLARLHGGTARLAPSTRGARFEVTLATGGTS